MMALKRKKTYEAQLTKLSGARMTIEQQLMAIEGAHVSLEAMNAMKMGASAMKAIHGEMYLSIFKFKCISQPKSFFSPGTLIRSIVRWMISGNKWTLQMKSMMPFLSH